MRHPPPAGSRRRAIPCNPPAPPLRGGTTAGPALTPASSFPAIPNPPTIPLPFREGAGDRSKPHHTWHYPCGFGPSGGRSARSQGQVFCVGARFIAPRRLSLRRKPQSRAIRSPGPGATPPLHMVERGPGGEARNPPRPLSSPHPPPICTTDGDWQMQELPGAPGTARQGRTRIIVSTNDGGVATQPRAPSHERPLAAQRAAGHGRLSADSGAPGADVPLATTAKAPGQHCLSAAPRAPGHGRPLAITAGAPVHDRLSAAPFATVSSPAGQHRLRQEGLLHNPANPRTLTHLHSHRDTTRNRTTHTKRLNRRSAKAETHVPP